MKPTIALLIVITASISISILASYITTITSFFPVRSWLYTEKSVLSPSPSSSLFLGPAGGSEIEGARGDVKPIQIYRTKIIPDIKDYYDILSVRLQLRYLCLSLGTNYGKFYVQTLLF